MPQVSQSTQLPNGGIKALGNNFTQVAPGSQGSGNPRRRYAGVDEKSERRTSENPTPSRDENTSDTVRRQISPEYSPAPSKH